MKKFIMLIILSFSTNIYAENCNIINSSTSEEEKLEITTDVPNHLRGKEICIRDPKTGVSDCVSTDQFKMVPRLQQFIVTKTKQVDKLVCKQDLKKNRISLLAGNGPKEGLETSKTASKVSVETDVGLVGGLQYQRLLNDRISLGGQLQSNEAVLLNIGLDF